jgi:hypothetical protein
VAHTCALGTGFTLVYLYRGRVLNRFVHRCAQKFVMANETTGFGGLNFFLSYLECTSSPYVNR